MTPQTFEATRVINYQNSFLPRIQGKFKPLVPNDAAKGTAIHIKMTLHPWTMGSLLVWELLWLGMISPALIHTPFNRMTLMLVTPAILAFGLTWLSFWAEARRSRRDLLQIIGGGLKV